MTGGIKIRMAAICCLAMFGATAWAQQVPQSRSAAPAARTAPERVMPRAPKPVIMEISVNKTRAVSLPSPAEGIVVGKRSDSRRELRCRQAQAGVRDRQGRRHDRHRHHGNRRPRHPSARRARGSGPRGHKGGPGPAPAREQHQGGGLPRHDIPDRDRAHGVRLGQRRGHRPALRRQRRQRHQHAELARLPAGDPPGPGFRDVPRRAQKPFGKQRLQLGTRRPKGHFLDHGTRDDPDRFRHRQPLGGFRPLGQDPVRYTRAPRPDQDPGRTHPDGAFGPDGDFPCRRRNPHTVRRRPERKPERHLPGIRRQAPIHPRGHLREPDQPSPVHRNQLGRHDQYCRPRNQCQHPHYPVEAHRNHHRPAERWHGHDRRPD